jgi:hypothetical protein
MSALREEDEPALLDEQQALKVAQSSWLGVMGVLSGLSTTVDPQLLALPIGVGSVAIAVLKRKQYAVERVLADPPRHDYTTETRARRRRYVPGAFGEDRLGLAIDQAAIATLRATAYMDAAVRADERSQGARGDGADERAEWQLSQAHWLMDNAKARSAEMASALDVLSMAWTAHAADSRLGEVLVPDVAPGRELPSRAHDTLRRVGLVVDDLDLSADPSAAAEHYAAGIRPRTFLDSAIESAQSTRALAGRAEQVAGRPGGLGSLAERRGLPVSIAEDYRRGLSAREAGDLAEAQQYMLRAAEGGSADAMFELGAIAGSRGDQQEARRWLDMAAERNPPQLKIVFESLEGPPASPRLPMPQELGDGPDDQG